MALNDILPIAYYGRKAPPTREYTVAATQTLARGEPVLLNANGQIEECADNPSAVIGIMAESASSLAENSRVPVWLISNTETLWLCATAARNGAGTSVTPDVTDIGDQCGLILLSGSWIADTGAGNKIAEVVDVDDGLGRSITDTRILLPGRNFIIQFFAR